MIRLARIFDALAPLVFLAAAISLAVLSVQGWVDGKIAFGTGRAVVYFDRSETPEVFLLVLIAYLGLFITCIRWFLLSLRWRRQGGKS